MNQMDSFVKFVNAKENFIEIVKDLMDSGVCCVFHTQKLFKMYYSIKLKTLVYVSLFICLLCVCNFSLHLN